MMLLFCSLSICSPFGHVNIDGVRARMCILCPCIIIVISIVIIVVVVVIIIIININNIIIIIIIILYAAYALSGVSHDPMTNCH